MNPIIIYLILLAWVLGSLPLAWIIGRFIHKGSTLNTVTGHAETDNRSMQ